MSDRAKKYQADLLEFMDSHVYPAEAVYHEQTCASGDPHFHPPIIEELKAEARRRGLWNLFHPHPEWGTTRSPGAAPWPASANRRRW